MAEDIGNLQVVIGADIAAFESGMAQVQADLGRVAAAADAAAGPVEKGAQRITDAQGRVRDGFGKFVNSAQLAADAAGNVGGSLGSLGDVAGRTGQTINQGLVSSFGAFDQAIKPLDAGIGRLGEGLKNIGSGLTTYVTLPLGLAAGAALAAYGKIDSLTRGLNALATQDVAKTGATGVEAIGLAAQATQARLAELQEIAKAPAIGFEEAVKGDIRLRAVGISAAQSAKILREFANAIALTGGGAAELNSVTVQLGQLSAKGKVLAQDLRPIIEAAPAVSQALQKLYGTVDSETISKSLEKQGKSSTDFVATLTDELGKLPRVAGGFNNALENFTQGGIQNLARLGESINKAFNLEGLLDRVGNAVTGLVDYFASLSPATQKFVLGAAAVAAAAGPIIFGLGAITAAIPSVVAGLEVLGLASTAALGPLGIGVAAVAAAAALIITHWQELTAYFSSNGEGGQVFSSLAESVGNAVGEISAALGQLQTEGDGSFGGLISATGVLRALFRDVVVGLESIANVAGGAIGAIARLLTGDFVGAAKQAERALYGLIDPLAGVFGFTKQNSTGFSDFFKGILPAAQQAATGIDYFANAGDNATKKVTTLKELLAELKTALEQRFADAQAGRDTTADDANIARIRALIAEYKQLPGHVDAATKAIQKLRSELAALTILDDVLAVPANGIDVVQRRIDTLNAGLKRLLEAGVKPSSAAFEAFAQESLRLQRSLAGVQASAELASKPIDLKLKVTVGDFNPDQLGKFSQELLDHPVLVPFTLTPLKTDFSKEILDATTGLQDSLRGIGTESAIVGEAMKKAGVEGAVLGNQIDLLHSRTEAYKAALLSLATQGVPVTSAAFQKLRQDYEDAAVAEERAKDLADTLKSGFEALGNSISTSLNNGQGILKGVLAGLIDALADFAEKKGKLLIASGIGEIALGNFIQGGLQIAAGTGLIVAAGVGHSYASGLTSASGGGGSVSSPSTSYSSASSGSGGTGASIPQTIELKLRGQDAVAILRLQDYRVSRTG